VRHWSFVAVALTIAIMVGGAGALLAYDSSQAHTIADGILAAGAARGPITIPTRTIPPKVTTSMLAARYPTVITGRGGWASSTGPGSTARTS
jgi:hypothetical protein